MREFETGATRDSDDGKYDYEGFLSPLVLARYAEYMHKNRVQADGSLRSSDNWQKGIPLTAYMKSGWRHFMDWWRLHRAVARGGAVLEDDLQEAICGVLFNAMGYLHELLSHNESQNYANLLLDEGLTADNHYGRVVKQRRSPWWPEERFGNGH